jgi:hypothetical protein
MVNLIPEAVVIVIVVVVVIVFVIAFNAIAAAVITL